MKTTLKKGRQVIAFIYDYEGDINIRKLAVSAPVAVGAAKATNPAAYVFIAYLQFANTTSDDAWPIAKPTARFDIVNGSGESFQAYAFPDATTDD